ncbi:enoyl-CoA hydratase-related protein [Roseateles amylovorans]|uniref:Enoyl-CoA hydratase-related protein n=1 Tax=Roseateles amylovorans TaxID=2978473 RepID=A0ABY6BBP9_9BURK|nr:enoyl-CoA hydratase-related protein [Roseateles amylovorans]UXH81022.1 enoyl-CoA hydratase-related protein [Roseateles amylovorans]
MTTDARGVARVMMNRPAVFNAFNEAMIGELDAAFAALAEDASVRVIVLCGAGKSFSAGADIQWMKRASEATQAWNLEDARRFAGMLDRIARCPKPTVARVHGLALGGGVGLTLACDIAIASGRATFAVSEARLGILPSVIGPYVINAVGPRQARRLALTAGRIDAREALQLGLVQQVVGEGDGPGTEGADGAEATALDLAVDACVSDLLASGPQAQAEIKTLFAQLAAGPITEQVRELTAQTIARVRMGAEAKEGFAAFFDKRPAGWVPQGD